MTKPTRTVLIEVGNPSSLTEHSCALSSETPPPAAATYRASGRWLLATVSPPSIRTLSSLKSGGCCPTELT
jgi:hypothetical protein